MVLDEFDEGRQTGMEWEELRPLVTAAGIC
jgi:hypothetical protein